MASLTRRLRRAGRRRNPRPRGWQRAGMRTHAQLSEARLAYVAAIEAHARGLAGDGPAASFPAYRVTRRWPA